MVNQDILTEKINTVQRCLKRIRDTVTKDEQRLSAFDKEDIIVLNLQRAVQATIDLASHVVNAENLGIPKTLKDTFLLLEKNQYISKDITLKMCHMVGFRNIAVHDYQTIEPAILSAVIKNHLGDFENFYQQVLKKCT